MGGPFKKNIGDNEIQENALLSPTFLIENQKEDVIINKLASLENKSITHSFSEDSLNSNLNPKKNFILNFILPTDGLNFGKLHPRNAVDIANSCGTDVLASADGLVIEIKSTGWNGGYGKYIKIEHLNNIKTLYAHLSKTNVSLGQKVKQGEKIGEVGQSGEATGCHLHFEVLGAKNPFATN
jgi:murein DD-endopeptidase MepM/ murein hydrolase activator NlpD